MKRLCSGLLAALVLASGCSSNGADNGLPVDGPEVGDGIPPDLALVEQSFDGELRLGLQRPETYVPTSVVLTDQSAVIVADLLYDGLTEAVGRQGELRPGLAAEWWSDAGYTEWTFRLDPDAGVTAETVVESLTPLTGVGAFGGRGEPGASALLAADVSSVTALDDNTVVIELGSPNAGLPWVLSGLAFSVVGPDGSPTGDFQITADDTNGMILGRRADRPGDDRIEIDRVTVTWVADGQAADELLIRGRVHAVVSADLPTGVGQPVEAIATAATRFYVLDTRSPSFADPADRLALLAAIDRSMIEADNDIQHLVPVDGLVGAGMAGYRPGACGTACVHNADLAAPESVGPIRLSFAGQEQSATAAAIVGQLVAAGIEAEQSELTPQALASAIVDGEIDMFAFGWVAAATSIDAVVPPLLTVDSPANVARVDSPTVAALLQQASVTPDDAQRWDILDQAQRAALEEGLILPVAGSASMLHQPPHAPMLVIRADGSLDLETTG